MNDFARISTATLAIALVLPGMALAESAPTRLTSPLAAKSTRVPTGSGATQLETPTLSPLSSASAATKQTVDPTGVPVPDSHRGSPCSPTGYEFYGSGLISQSIPDGDPGGVLLGPFATDPNCRPVGDVIVTVQMEHTWIGDLRIDILYDEDNNGSFEAFAPLLCRPGVDDCSESTTVFGCDGDLAGVYGFSDSATETLGEILFGTCFETHPSGCYLPEPIFANSLADLEGFPMGGSFYLYAIDYVGGDLGTIEEVTVFVQPDETRDVPSEFATVQAAVDAACPGDRIVVAPGIYDEVVTILDRSLVIEGDPQDLPHITQIDYVSSESVFPDNVLTGLSVGTITGNSEFDLFSTISQCTVGTISGLFERLEVDNSEVTLLEARTGFAMTIEDCQIGALSSPYIELFTARRSTFSNGLGIEGIEDATIEDCEVGTSLSIAPMFARRNPLAYETPAREIAPTPSPTGAMGNGSARRTFPEPRVGSIFLTRTDVGGDVTFDNDDESTRFTDCEIGGTITSSANSIYLTNTTAGGNCTLIGGDRVEVVGSQVDEQMLVNVDELLVIRDNFVLGGITADVTFGFGSAIEVSGNVLGGIDLDAASDGAALLGNTFWGSSGSLGTGIAITTSGDVDLVRNIVDGFGTGIQLAATGNITTTCNCVFNNSVDWTGIPDPTGTDGNISANPQFCLPGVDFSLESTSPCLPGNHPDGFGCGGAIGAFETDCAASDAPETIPSAGAIGIQAHPNPSSDSLTLSWQLAESVGRTGDRAGELTEVQIFAVDGRAVWSRAVSASIGSVSWDLRNEQGVRVSPGMYFARVGNGSDVQTARVMVVR